MSTWSAVVWYLAGVMTFPFLMVGLMVVASVLGMITDLRRR